ncbi:MAG: AAA family ATPase, partial [Burkholderiaceae bacterium]
RPGALHRANGGYLVIDAAKLLNLKKKALMTLLLRRWPKWPHRQKAPSWKHLPKEMSRRPPVKRSRVGLACPALRSAAAA